MIYIFPLWQVFQEMDALVGPNTVLSSSTSCILPSKFTKDLVNKANCIVSHPVCQINFGIFCYSMLIFGCIYIFLTLACDEYYKLRIYVIFQFNPPYYVPAIEVVPSPWTSQDVMKKTCSLLVEIGLIPIKFRRESIGFASNRIQYAIKCFLLLLIYFTFDLWFFELCYVETYSV